jgi:hypothetical protein
MSVLDQPIRSPSVWKGSELDWRQEALHVFNDSEIDELDQALAHLRAQGDIDLPDIAPETFPLPIVSAFLARMKHALRFGRGFMLLRGIPRERYSADDMARIYFGLGSYLGVPMIQSYLGDVLGHVMNVSDVEPESRGYRQGGGQFGHTDSCDIVALMCLRAAKSGGRSRIASATAVYNELLEHHPEMARALRNGVYVRRADADGNHATGVLSRGRIAFYTETQSEVICYLPTGYSRRAIVAADPGREWTELEKQALEMVDTIVKSDAFHLDMDFQEGDIQFLNNRLIIHSRTDYEDWPEISQRRHLMRLWLSVPDWPKMPENQILHTDEDHRLWGRNRRPMMEMPSIQLRDLERRKKQLQPTMD